MLIENKQRLVGIIVLAVFIALLIPFLFVGNSGQKNTASKAIDNGTIPTTTIQSNAPVSLPEQTMAANYSMPQNAVPSEIPAVSNQSAQITPGAINQAAVPASIPVQTTTEQAENAQVAPTVQQKPAVINPPVNAPVQTAPAPITAPMHQVAPSQVSGQAAPVTAPVNLAAPVSPAQPSAPQQLPVKATTSVTSPAAATTDNVMQKSTPTTSDVTQANVVKPIKKHVANKHVISKKTETSAAKHEVWAVQVGSFADQKHVNRVVSELKANGFHGMTQKVKTAHGTLTRIVVGHEASREQAEKMAAKIEKTLKLKGNVIRMQS